MDHLVNIVHGYFYLDKDSVLVDVGGGTGNFTRKVIKDGEAIVVDPFLEQSHTGAKDDKVSFKAVSAEEFAATNRKGGYTHVLLKEVVHHLENRVDTFAGLKRVLQSTNNTPRDQYQILILTRPQTQIDYPLWNKARDVWAANQPSLEDFQSELERAGFTEITSRVAPYPCQIPLEVWQAMVRDRFWSTFSNFTDDELEQGCQDIAQEYKDRVDSNGILHFQDRILCIAAKI